MNPQELPLADIHLPDEITFWPLAPGWWLLLVLSLLLIITCIILARRFKQHRVQKQLALIELKHIDLQAYTASQKINEVLKRAALAYLPREEVAALTGAQWKAFLLSHMGKKPLEFEEDWLHFAYCGKVDQSSVYRYHAFAQAWVKTALPLKRRTR